MNNYLPSLEHRTQENTHFRHVIYTSTHMQLVLMHLNPGEEIGVETHDVDQFFRCESGQGVAIVSDKEHALTDGAAIIIPGGLVHNIKNTGDTALKLYTIYAPPHHKDGTIHHSASDAANDTEHFDGITSDA